MSARKLLDEEFASLFTIKTLVETYQEIAAIRMQKVRSSVLANRVFLEELSEIYKQLRHSYDAEVMKIVKKSLRSKNKSNSYKLSSLISRNSKTVCVLLSSNAGLYGDIIRKVFSKFSSFIAKNSGMEVVIVGKRGRTFFKDVFHGRPYKYFEIEDHIVEVKDVSAIINHLIQYEKVIVFHGKYESVLSQLPVQSTISGELPEGIKQSVPKISFLFEPSLEKILVFFETEIMASIFDQSVNESNLSKFAARMISLDTAVINISDKLKKVNFARQQVKHREVNRKQLGTLSGMALWK